MASEAKLEDILAEDISILDSNLVLIGRQVPTAFGNSCRCASRRPRGK
jgi:hypothetical protein